MRLTTLQIHSDDSFYSCERKLVKLIARVKDDRGTFGSILLPRDMPFVSSWIQSLLQSSNVNHKIGISHVK